jgi:hypothetical protein
MQFDEVSTHQSLFKFFTDWSKTSIKVSFVWTLDKYNIFLSLNYLFGAEFHSFPSSVVENTYTLISTEFHFLAHTVLK